MKLVVATCQFPVGRDPAENKRHVLRQMRQSAKRGAHVVHFCEGALSGYAGSDFDSFRGFDWDLLRECSGEVLELARELQVWVLLGSSHPLSGRRKPHNCVYVIDDRGRIVDRYDKRFCAADGQGASRRAGASSGSLGSSVERARGNAMEVLGDLKVGARSTAAGGSADE